MLAALSKLGVTIEEPLLGAKRNFKVHGVGGAFQHPFATSNSNNTHSALKPLELFLGNSGTAMRPLAAVRALSIKPCRCCC